MNDPIPTINGQPAVSAPVPPPAPEPVKQLTEQEIYTIVSDAIRNLVRYGTVASTEAVRNLIRAESNSSDFRHGVQQAVEIALKNRQFEEAYRPPDPNRMRQQIFAPNDPRYDTFRVTDEDIHALQLKQVHQAVAAFKKQIGGQVQALTALVQQQNQLIIKLLRMSIAEQLKPEALQAVVKSYEAASGFETFGAPSVTVPMPGMAGIVAEEIQEISP